MVHHLVQRFAFVGRHFGAQNGRVLRFLHRFKNQRGVGGGILGLVGGDLFEVPGICDHGRKLF